MSASRRRGIALALLAPGLLLLILSMLLTFTHAVGTDEKLYYALQTRYGADEEDMEALDRALAAYLKGDEQALEAAGAFNARELYHMADVFRLFVLLRRVRAVLLICALLLCAGGAVLGGPDRWRIIRRAALMADGALLLAVAALALWAKVDFTGLFHAFHRLLFTNELWILYPETDVLIRICPENMFRDMAARIALYTVIFAACLPLVAEIPDTARRIVDGLRAENADKGQ